MESFRFHASAMLVGVLFAVAVASILREEYGKLVLSVLSMLLATLWMWDR